MAPEDERFTRALAAIDAANAADPIGEELPYSRRMTAWLEQLSPAAPDYLKLAARAQHLRRWEIPRSSFPMDRIGYLKWRTTLYQFHADQAAAILRACGYDDATIARVASLLKKQNLKSDPDAQLLEDTACLVFLQYEFTDFLAQHAADEPKVLNILQRTWKKMSPQGHAAATSLLPSLPPAARDTITKALSPHSAH
jgi:hypothetical protein